MTMMNGAGDRMPPGERAAWANGYAEGRDEGVKAGYELGYNEGFEACGEMVVGIVEALLGAKEDKV